MRMLLVVGLLGWAGLGCTARSMLGAAKLPLVEVAQWPEGSRLEREGERLVASPVGPVRAHLVLFHGFASLPRHHEVLMRELAAEGVRVVAPPLPDYHLFIGRYHDLVRSAALEAYDRAAEEARQQGLPAPLVGGFSMGGGAALAVAAARSVPAMLWAPVPLDGRLPEPVQPLLILQASEDCIAKGRPLELAQALGERARLVRLEGANHVGFTDVRGLERNDCPARLERAEQRRLVREHTLAFLREHGAQAATVDSPHP